MQFLLTDGSIKVIIDVACLCSAFGLDNVFEVLAMFDLFISEFMLCDLKRGEVEKCLENALESTCYYICNFNYTCTNRCADDALRCIRVIR